MIVGIGTDLTEIDRVQALWEKYGQKFADKILTPGEQAQLPRHPVPRMAALFACKEAAVKALGTGFRQGIHARCVEVLHRESGKPDIQFLGAGLERCREMGVLRAHVTMTHSRDTAAATVILEG